MNWREGKYPGEGEYLGRKGDLAQEERVSRPLLLVVVPAAVKLLRYDLGSVRHIA